MLNQPIVRLALIVALFAHATAGIIANNNIGNFVSKAYAESSEALLPWTAAYMKAQLQDPTEVEVGGHYIVGDFFWIKDFIGYTDDAVHGHGLDENPGSADVGNIVEVLDFTDNNRAVVVLYRNKIPYGAPAPIGTIFTLPVEQIKGWSVQLDALKKAEERRGEILLRIQDKL